MVTPRCKRRYAPCMSTLMYHNHVIILCCASFRAGKGEQFNQKEKTQEGKVRSIAELSTETYVCDY